MSQSINKGPLIPENIQTERPVSQASSSNLKLSKKQTVEKPTSSQLKNSATTRTLNNPDRLLTGSSKKSRISSTKDNETESLKLYMTELEVMLRKEKLKRIQLEEMLKKVLHRN